jgi:choline dehydrogenase
VWLNTTVGNCLDSRPDVLSFLSDVAAWEKLGNPGWNWNAINKHIMSIESFTPAPPEIAQNFGSEDAGHGTHGPINVSFSNYYEPNSVIPAFAKTMQSLGVSGNKAAVCIYNLS